MPAKKLTPSYHQLLWESAVLTKDKVMLSAIKMAADFAIHHQDKYKIVSAVTGVPWQLIAGIHMRERARFDCGLHCGQPWNEVTTKKPQGRGPFNSWEEAAVDALQLLNFHKVKTWNIPKMLEMAERYNGLGYFLYHPEVNIPYVWSGTNHYKVGKYAKDGSFDPNLKDAQPGIAALFMEFQARGLPLP